MNPYSHTKLMQTRQIIILFLTIVSAAAAETPLQQLRQRYDKDRVDGITSLNKRYVQALQPELRRAIAQKDAKATAEIDAWISQLDAEVSEKAAASNRSANTAAGKDPREWLVGATWSTSSAEFRFAADGVGTKLYRGKVGVIKWILLDDNTVEAGNGGLKEYFFIHSANRGEFATAKNAPRSPLTRKK